MTMTTNTAIRCCIRPSMRKGLVLCGLLIALPVASQAQVAPGDVTQWRGANRDGVITGFAAPAVWPEQLTQRWNIDVGLGYATPLVVGDRVYMFARQGDDEVMSAIDSDSGEVLWRTSYHAPFTMHSAAVPHGAGPKSTPVLSNGRLFAIGMTGIVTGFDVESGAQVWQKPGSPLVPLYTSHAFSPVVEGDTVIFHLGGEEQGELTAHDVSSGDVVWSWDGDAPGYGSPIVAAFGGVRQLVTITKGKLVGIDVATGGLLWERPFVSSNSTNSITPVLYGQTVIVWGHGGPTTAVSVAQENGQWVTETVWENADINGRMSNAVLSGDVMFGLTSRNSGQYYAVEAETGQVLWTSEGRQAGNAAMVRAGDVVFSLEDDGELVILRASQSGFEPLRRYSVAEDETWTQPAISGDRVFVKDVSTLTLWSLN
jgi:outer membrane protein assembly factor BamB